MLRCPLLMSTPTVHFKTKNLKLLVESVTGHPQGLDKDKDKDKMLKRPNICYAFEKQGVQGYQI